jgi:RNA polymerase sigma-70 factor (ECF subfamily)
MAALADHDVEATRGEVPPQSPGVPMTSPEGESVYQVHFSFVWRTLRALGVPHGQLDDAVQDVFLVVHRRLSEFEGRAQLRTWLFSIVQNVAANYRRRQRRKGGLEPLDDLIMSDRATPLEQAQEREAARFVERFLRQLDDDKRVVFVLIVLEQMSAPEAAEVLSVPLNTVYSRLRAARQAFRTHLKQRAEVDLNKKERP